MEASFRDAHPFRQLPTWASRGSSLGRAHGMFQWWAASMRHRDIDAASSELIYTFTLRLRPKWLGRVLDHLVNRLFEWETRNRFAAMAVYLRARA